MPLLRIAKTPINSGAYNAEMRLADHGFPEFGEEAVFEVRPHRYAKHAQSYHLRGSVALNETRAQLLSAPLDPEEAAEILTDAEAAMQAYEVGYASLVIAGMRNILVLDEPATAKDVEEASREPFQSSRAEVVELPEDGGKILAAKHVTVTGYDLEEGLCFLPWSNRNVWKILSLRPELAAHVFTFATDPENFPEMPDPLASRRSGKTGAKSTSSTETPPGEGSKSPKRAGKPRSSRKSS